MKTYIDHDTIEGLDPFVWIYNCGWYIQGSHPYRNTLCGIIDIQQTIGWLEFYRETGVLPWR